MFIIIGQYLDGPGPTSFGCHGCGSLVPTAGAPGRIAPEKEANLP